MIILDVSIKDVLKKYPALQDALPLECDCGRTYGEEDIEVYMTKRNIGFVGLRFGGCDCGVPLISVSVPRTKEAEQEMRELLIETMKGRGNDEN